MKTDLKILCCIFRLADLAIECELQKAPSNEMLLTVFANRDDVECALIQPVCVLVHYLPPSVLKFQ